MYVIVFLMVVILFALYQPTIQNMVFNIRSQPAVRKLDTIVGRYKYMMEDFDGTLRDDPSCTFDEYPDGKNRCFFKDYVLKEENGNVYCRHPDDKKGTYQYNVLPSKTKSTTKQEFKDWLQLSPAQLQELVKLVQFG